MYEHRHTLVTASETELWEQYRDMLDETSGPVRIGGLEYAASVALERVDPVAFRCGFNDWADAAGWEEARD